MGEGVTVKHWNIESWMADSGVGVYTTEGVRTLRRDECLADVEPGWETGRLGLSCPVHGHGCGLVPRQGIAADDSFGALQPLDERGPFRSGGFHGHGCGAPRDRAYEASTRYYRDRAAYKGEGHHG